MRATIKNFYSQCTNKCVTVVALVFLFITMLSSVSWLMSRIYMNSMHGNISDKLSVYEDTTEELSYEDILSKKEEFVNVEKSFIDANYSQNAYWIRIPNDEIQTKNLDDSFIIALDDPNFVEILAYYTDSSGNIKELQFNERTAVLPFLRFQKDFDISEDLYLRVISMAGPFRVHKARVEGFFLYTSYLGVYILFTIGILFATYLVDILLAFIFREKYFVLFAIYQNFVLLYVYLASGIARLYFGIDSFWYVIVGYALCISSLMFIYSYLQLNKKMPLIGKTNIGLSIIIGLLIVLTLASEIFFTRYQNMIYIAGMLVNFFVFIWMLLTLIIYAVKKNKISVFFLIGMTVQVAFIMLYILGNSSIIEENVIFKISFMFAGAINGILFTLGILFELKDVKEKNAIFYKLAITDKLTGAYNRYYFEKRLSELIEKNNEGSKLVLAILDIDHFKLVNDKYGHDMGDYVLKEMVTLIKTIIREEDVLFRWGGEEFAVLFDNSLMDDVISIGERIRISVSEYNFKEIGQVTVSIGVSSYISGEDTENWFKRVDTALYEAKNSGRNCLKAVR